MFLRRPTNCLLLLLLVPWLIDGQMPYPQYGPVGNNDPFQQQQQQQQQMYPQQQMYQQQQQQQPQQPFYQGNPGGGMQMPFPPAPVNNEPLAPAAPGGNSENYLVGNLSQPYSFHVAPPSSKVNHLGLNGFSLFIKGMGFSDKSRFNYDEQTNLLTVLSLDRTTVGYYVAVDANWQTLVTVVSAINVSSLEIRNFQTSDQNNNNNNNGSSLVSCSVSIVRSTFKPADPPSPSGNSLPSAAVAVLPPRMPSNLAGTEYLPRLDVFVAGRSSQPMTKIPNDTLNEQIFTRTLTLQRPLTRADHNGTIQCQVESTTNMNVFLVKSVQADVQYGPELETGATERVDLRAEALLSIAMDCQIEGNPSPSYVWYELLNSNMSTGMMPYYGQQNPYGQYPLQPGIPTAGLSVFGTTRQIQKIFQNPGQHVMQCQAQSRGKTIKQEFFINVQPSASALKDGKSDGGRGKSYKVPMIIGISVGSVLLFLLLAIVAAALIFIRRRKRAQTKEPHSVSSEKLSADKPGGKDRWGHSSSGGIHPKYKQPSSRVDSTSPLVESGDSYSSQGPPIPHRSSPLPSREPSYRQAPNPVSLSYVQASSISGVRPPPTPMRSYSPEPEEIPTTTSNTRSRTTTPFGSHKSLTESIQSLRSTQQRAISLPMKKKSDDPPPLPAPILPKREQRTPSPRSVDPKKDYQHHHYHNPAQLRAEQQRGRRPSSDEEDEDSAFLPKKFTFRVGGGVPAPPIEQQQVPRRARTPPPPQKIVVHHPTALHRDEIPPSYQQVANPSSSFVYQEPTEV